MAGAKRHRTKHRLHLRPKILRRKSGRGLPGCASAYLGADGQIVSNQNCVYPGPPNWVVMRPGGPVPFPGRNDFTIQQRPAFIDRSARGGAAGTSRMWESVAKSFVPRKWFPMTSAQERIGSGPVYRRAIFNYDKAGGMAMYNPVTGEMGRSPNATAVDDIMKKWKDRFPGYVPPEVRPAVIGPRGWNMIDPATGALVPSPGAPGYTPQIRIPLDLGPLGPVGQLGGTMRKGWTPQMVLPPYAKLRSTMHHKGGSGFGFDDLVSGFTNGLNIGMPFLSIATPFIPGAAPALAALQAFHRL